MKKLLFVTQNPFSPDSLGGAQKSANYLFQSLIKQNWQVEVICATSIKSKRLRKQVCESIFKLKIPKYFTKDDELGYICWRHIAKYSNESQWTNLLEWRLKQFEPDIVLGDSTPNCVLLRYSMSKGYKTFYIGRNINITKDDSVLPADLIYLANSPFVASIISQIIDRDVEFILPFVDVNLYKVEERDGKYITFVNPVLEKGVEVAIQTAKALPNEKFLFVKGKWSHIRQEQMEDYLKPAYEMPNIEIWENQHDMKEVYKVTDIMLVPSQFIETFGRVILEAQINRIPVVAARVGGIPYTLGDGGILVHPKHKFEGYVDAIKQLKSNESFYKEISGLAFKNSSRPEFNPQLQVERFINIIEKK